MIYMRVCARALYSTMCARAIFNHVSVRLVLRINSDVSYLNKWAKEVTDGPKILVSIYWILYWLQARRYTGAIDLKHMCARVCSVCLSVLCDCVIVWFACICVRAPKCVSYSVGHIRKDVYICTFHFSFVCKYIHIRCTQVSSGFIKIS